MGVGTAVVRWVSGRLLPGEQRERLARLRYADAGHGFDVFGMHPDWVALGMGMFHQAYERYFRVESFGADNIPAEGPAILAANHAGLMPLDACLLYSDVVRHTDPPRVPRAVIDLFVGLLPFVGTFFSRAGGAPGTRRNFRALLEADQLLMVFPEGDPAIGKPWAERYRLYPFRLGHAELAIRHRVPVVPVAIIGSEEHWPLWLKIEAIRPMGAPFVPIPLTPPLPVRYRIRYGAPIRLHERWAPEQSDDPAVLREAAALVQAAVQAELDTGLALRPGVFT